jgi:hypothetical protein
MGPTCLQLENPKALLEVEVRQAGILFEEVLPSIV